MLSVFVDEAFVRIRREAAASSANTEDHSLVRFGGALCVALFERILWFILGDAPKQEKIIIIGCLQSVDLKFAIFHVGDDFGNTISV